MSNGAPTPNAALAAAAAKRATGRTPIEVRRFPTGAAHYVYEALSENGDAVVVRMGYKRQRDSLQAGLLLVQKLRPLGVPLAKILADGLDDPCPWIAMERLPGMDLGEVINSLSAGQLQDIARGVADAQRAASRVEAAGRYGYAAVPEAAPHAKWSVVLDENITRAAGSHQPALSTSRSSTQSPAWSRGFDPNWMLRPQRLFSTIRRRGTSSSRRKALCQESWTSTISASATRAILPL